MQDEHMKYGNTCESKYDVHTKVDSAAQAVHLYTASGNRATKQQSSHAFAPCCLDHLSATGTLLMLALFMTRIVTDYSR